MLPKKPPVPLGASRKVDRVDTTRNPADRDGPDAAGPEAPQTAAARPRTLSDEDAARESEIPDDMA